MGRARRTRACHEEVAAACLEERFADLQRAMAIRVRFYHRTRTASRRQCRDGSPVGDDVGKMDLRTRMQAHGDKYLKSVARAGNRKCPRSR